MSQATASPNNPPEWPDEGVTMDELTQEQIDEETKKIREEVTAEVFEDKAPEPIEAEKPLPIEPEPEPEDPWKDVSPALKKSFDEVSSQLGDFKAMETRLKQAERRIGSMQNEASEAKKVADEAAVKIAEAPTPEQIAKAEDQKKEWEALKTDFPEWANAIESKLSAQSTKLNKSMPDTGKLEEKFDKNVAGLSQKVAELSETIEKNSVSFKHPEWETIRDSKEFGIWLAGQPAETKGLTDSGYAKDAIKVLDAYADHKTKKSPAEIAAERQNRLKKAESVPRTTAIKQTKSEADQTDEEYRRSIGEKIWAEG